MPERELRLVREPALGPAHERLLLYEPVDERGEPDTGVAGIWLCPRDRETRRFTVSAGTASPSTCRTSCSLALGVSAP
ncbi:hypothetical protein BE20_07180, partial [Sorangium cellulosum]